MKSGVPVLRSPDVTAVIDAGAGTIAVQFPYAVSENTKLSGFTIQSGSYAVVTMGGGGQLVGCTILSDGDATDYGILHGGPVSVIDSCTVILEDTGVTSYGIALINSDASVQHTTVEIRDGTSYDWAVWMETNAGERAPSFSYGLVKAPGANGIHVEDGAVSFTTVDSTAGYGIQATAYGVAGQCIMTNASGGYEAGGGSSNFNYCIAYPGGFDYPAGGTGNSEDDPLCCDLAGSEYTLRVDSYGNPDNNASGYPTGAFPVACMFGTLARNAEYAGDGTLAFPGDLSVPAGLELVLGPGTTLDVSRTDSLATGNSASLVELNVSGRLEVNGSDSEPVVFDSEGQDQAEGDWYGISVNSGGANLWLSHAVIAHAGYGVSVGTADTAITIRDCAFEANEWIDIQVGGSDTSMAILIEDNTIDVGGGTGIEMD